MRLQYVTIHVSHDDSAPRLRSGRERRNMTTKEKAESYFNRIGEGHENAVMRPADGLVDRSLRRIVERANKNGDCIVNDGEGYFRPVPGDKVDELALNRYLNSELHRAREIQFKRLCMRQTFKSWCDSAMYSKHCAEARMDFKERLEMQ